MTQDEARLLDIDDPVLVRVEGEGWVPGRVVDVNFGKRRELRIDVTAADGRDFPHIEARFVKRGKPRQTGRKQDWSPREDED